MNYAYYEKFDHGKHFTLPIKTLDGLNVFSSINVVKHSAHCPDAVESRSILRLEINIYNCLSEVTKLIRNQTDFDKAIDEITHYKFNKLSNSFEDGREIMPDEAFYECLNSPNITLKWEECCVCLDKTSGLLACNHALCGMCASKLVKERCPLCRSRIMMFDSDEENSDDDSSTTSVEVEIEPVTSGSSAD